MCVVIPSVSVCGIDNFVSTQITEIRAKNSGIRNTLSVLRDISLGVVKK